jgi:hypothetical protein
MTLIGEKWARGILVLLISYTALSGVVRAANRLFWCNEVITVSLARLNSLSAVTDALAHAADSHPPPFYFAERAFGSLPVRGTISYRLPSILAYCCFVGCVFLFIQKRRGSEVALLCAAYVVTTVCLLCGRGQRLQPDGRVRGPGYGLLPTCRENTLVDRNGSLFGGRRLVALLRNLCTLNFGATPLKALPH